MGQKQVLQFILWTVVGVSIIIFGLHLFKGLLIDSRSEPDTILYPKLLSHTGGKQSNILIHDSVKTQNCNIISIERLESAKKTKYEIPLIIHQNYKNDQIPQQYLHLIKGCRSMNPDFIHVIWTDKEADYFMEKKYPQYKSLYSNYREGAQKSDFIRVLLLYHFGGVYMDMDVECRKPLSQHLDMYRASAILDQERHLQSRLLWNRNSTIMNSNMMSRKKHPFFKYLLGKFPESLKHPSALWRTGPFFLHDRLLEYQRQKHTGRDNVYVAPPSAFSPLLDSVKFGEYNKTCTGSYSMKSVHQRRGCVEWDTLKRRQDNEKELIKDSLLVHRFLHLVHVYQSWKTNIKKRTNVCHIEKLYKIWTV